MLAVDERTAVERFARLEELAVTTLADAARVEAEHAGERDTSARSVAARHAHPPVRRHELLAAARSTLMIEFREHDPVLHERPAGLHRHVHLHILRVHVVSENKDERAPRRDRPPPTESHRFSPKPTRMSSPASRC